MQNYFNSNKLKINTLKTQIMLWGKFKPIPHTKLKVNIQNIPTKDIGAKIGANIGAKFGQNSSTITSERLLAPAELCRTSPCKIWLEVTSGKTSQLHPTFAFLIALPLSAPSSLPPTTMSIMQPFNTCWRETQINISVEKYLMECLTWMYVMRLGVLRPHSLQL